MSISFWGIRDRNGILSACNQLMQGHLIHRNLEAMKLKIVDYGIDKELYSRINTYNSILVDNVNNFNHAYLSTQGGFYN